MKLLYLLLLIKVVLATQLPHRNHSCVPSAYTQMCILEHLQYKPDKEHVIHSFPPNRSHVRITTESRSSGRVVEMIEINAKLHTLLGKPKILEMYGYAMWKFELPRALWKGIFSKSHIFNLTVEPGTETPRVVYLDLSSNYLRDIANVSGLVNLEVLILSYNHISSIDATTMQNLTKLRILDLSHNFLLMVPMNIFPKSLTHLNLFACYIQSLNYDHLYYPSMEVLIVERNKLTSIDSTALMRAMPKLRKVRLGWNLFDLEELQEALQQFRQHNVSFRDEADEAACAFAQRVVEGVCIRGPAPPRSFLREIQLSLVVLVIGVALGVSIRWVYSVIQAK
uniref:Putative leucine-rich repeat protein n=2 Tax=Culex tarsalis TaxID=7177 RepID=A0A1Q3FRZ8_CULTA